ncbi:MAG: metal-sulfur cluster assembly factor [Gemmatimonadetes bacterium]|nr:metal-sulfur cluster assembly factor [Gemmatimonadota bacterium]
MEVLDPGLRREADVVPTTEVPGLVSETEVRGALARVQDPELPINIVDLGLVYAVRIDRDRVEVDLTHTALGCPAIEMMQEDVEAAVSALPGVREVRVTAVWDPPWTKARLTPRGRLALLSCGVSL